MPSTASLFSTPCQSGIKKVRYLSDKKNKNPSKQTEQSTIWARPETNVTPNRFLARQLLKCRSVCWIDDKKKVGGKKKVLCQWPMPPCTPVAVMISIHKHAVRYPPPGSCLCAYEITIMHLAVPGINISPLLKFASVRNISTPQDLGIPSGITRNLPSFYIHCSTLMGI